MTVWFGNICVIGVSVRLNSSVAVCFPVGKLVFARQCHRVSRDGNDVCTSCVYRVQELPPLLSPVAPVVSAPMVRGHGSAASVSYRVSWEAASARGAPITGYVLTATPAAPPTGAASLSESPPSAVSVTLPPSALECALAVRFVDGGGPGAVASADFDEPVLTGGTLYTIRVACTSGVRPHELVATTCVCLSPAGVLP